MAAGTKLKAGLFVEWVVFQGDFSLGPGFFFDLPGNGSANIAHGIGGGGRGGDGELSRTDKAQRVSWSLGDRAISRLSVQTLSWPHH